MRRAPGALALSALASTTSWTQSGGAPIQIVPLVQTGESVTGVGTVTAIEDVAVIEGGSWLVRVDTDHPDPLADGAILKDGALWYREGQALAYPAGTTIATFEDTELAPGGDVAWTCILGGAVGSDEDAALYWNQKLLLREGGSIPAPEIPGAALRKVLALRVNAARQILALAQIDDPAIPTEFDHVLLRLDIDAGGNLIGAEALFKEGDLLTGLVQPIADFAYNEHALGWNDAGLPLFFADLTGDIAGDGVIALDGIALAQEGAPSPVPGQNWSSLALPKLALTPTHSLYSGYLDGDAAANEVLVVDGAVAAREGQTLAAIAPYTLKGFGTGPALLSHGGQPIWFGDWDEPVFPGTSGLFRGTKLLVRENATLVGGATVALLAGAENGFAASRSGNYVVFEATLSSGVDGAYLARPAAETVPIPGCGGNPGQLWISGSPPALGSTVVVHMGASPLPFAVGRVFFSAKSFVGADGCGPHLPGLGEILIDVSPFAMLGSVGGPWTGATLAFPIPISADTSIAGAEVFAQGVFIDVLGIAPSAPIALTNALECWLGY